MQAWKKITGAFPSWPTITAILAFTLLGAIAFGNKGFLTANTLMNIARRAASEGGIAALGLTFVMLTGHIDLSVGAVAALGGVTAALLQTEGALIAIPAALCAGLLCGFLNGIMTARMRLPSWLATLGMMCLARNLAQLVSSQRTISISSAIWQKLGSTGILGIHILVLVFILLTLVCMYISGYTAPGKALYAMGAGPAAAQKAGLHTQRILISAFSLSGIFSALAGVLLAGRLYTASYSAGSGWEVSVLAMCVLGGVRFTGGKGRFSGVFFGALLVALITTLCSYSAVLGLEWQNMILCLVVLAAALIQSGGAGIRKPGTKA